MRNENGKLIELDISHYSLYRRFRNYITFGRTSLTTSLYFVFYPVPVQSRYYNKCLYICLSCLISLFNLFKILCFVF